MSTTKVAPVAPVEASADEGKRKRKKRPTYSLPEGVDKLKVEPSDWSTIDLAYFAGYDEKQHGPLKKVHFADAPSYYAYRAWRGMCAHERDLALAHKWATEGPKLAKLRKAERLRKQFAQLREQLSEMGMSADEIESALSAGDES